MGQKIQGELEGGGGPEMAVVFVASVVVYLLLVWSGGGLDPGEVVVAGFVAFWIALVARKRLKDRSLSLKGIDPRRWGRFFCYLGGPFLVGLVKANLDVAARVVTGHIRPGIVKVTPDLRTDVGLTLLANSITLTPGTLTVDVDESDRSLYIHCLYVAEENPSGEDLYGSFETWARRIAE